MTKTEHTTVFGRPGKTKVEAHGWTIEDHPGEFHWIEKSALVVDMAYQRDRLRCACICSPEPIPCELFAGLFTLDSYLQKVGIGTVDDEAIATKLEDVGIACLRDRIKRAVIYREKGGAKVWAQGIIDAINHKRRNRIPDIYGGASDGGS